MIFRVDRWVRVSGYTRGSREIMRPRRGRFNNVLRKEKANAFEEHSRAKVRSEGSGEKEKRYAVTSRRSTLLGYTM